MWSWHNGPVSTPGPDDTRTNDGSPDTSDPRRALPSVDQALRRPMVAAAMEHHPRAAVVAAVRQALERRRQDGPSLIDFDDEVLRALQPSLRRAINATGVILHTNLGRAPLADEAIAAAVAAAGYATVEWDGETGHRGSRHSHVQLSLRALTGAPSGCVVNTNAGAILLALVSLAAGGDVLVSRGELVEIGGGFRVPEVLAASGCRLVEVGTTNKTRLDDYARAITSQTRAILRVHPSNYRVVGFTESTPLVDLVRLAAEHDLVVIDDLGSGALDGDWVFRGEPDARGAIAAGVDVAAFSGDKLLGGPQCGILVGSADAIARCTGHPLMRALRPDKLTLAALDATLRLHQEQATRRTIPTIRMLGATATELQERAEQLAAGVGGQVVQTVGRVGGGSLPLEEIVSFAVAVPAPEGPEVCAARLRAFDPPIVARVADGRVLLDVLAMSDRDVEDVAAAVGGA